VKEGKAKKNKDPDAPKKPVGGAYGCFMNANRAQFQKECPDSITGVAKLAGERWKNLPAAEKEKYEKFALNEILRDISFTILERDC